MAFSSTSIDTKHDVRDRKDSIEMMRLCGAYIFNVISRQILQSGCRNQPTGSLKENFFENDQQSPLQLPIRLKLNEAVSRNTKNKASLIEGECRKITEAEISSNVPADLTEPVALGQLLVSKSAFLAALSGEYSKRFTLFIPFSFSWGLPSEHFSFFFTN